MGLLIFYGKYVQRIYDFVTSYLYIKKEVSVS